MKNFLATYNIGLMQTKAYRALKAATAELLKDYNITSIEWALLGALYDNPEGIKLNQLAKELGVEAPFITSLVNKFEKQNLVKKTFNTQDKRSKLVVMTAKGKDLVPQIESMLRKEMRKFIKNVSGADLIVYVQVLKSISDVADHKDN